MILSDMSAIQQNIGDAGRTRSASWSAIARGDRGPGKKITALCSRPCVEPSRRRMRRFVVRRRVMIDANRDWPPWTKVSRGDTLRYLGCLFTQWNDAKAPDNDRSLRQTAETADLHHTRL